MGRKSMTRFGSQAHILLNSVLPTRKKKKKKSVEKGHFCAHGGANVFSKKGWFFSGQHTLGFHIY